MSNELPWKVWTPDDLAPPMAEFVLADHSETPLSEEAETLPEAAVPLPNTPKLLPAR